MTRSLTCSEKIITKKNRTVYTPFIQFGHPVRHLQAILALQIATHRVSLSVLCWEEKVSNQTLRSANVSLKHTDQKKATVYD